MGEVSSNKQRERLVHVAIYHADGTAVSGGCHVGISAQSLGDRAVALNRGPWLFALLLRLATSLQLRLINVQGELALVDVNGDGVAVFNQTDEAAVGCLRGDVADG